MFLQNLLGRVSAVSAGGGKTFVNMWTYDAKFSQMSEKGIGEYFGAKDGDTKGAINSPNNRFMWKMLGRETLEGGDIYSSHDYDKLSDAHDRNNISAAAKGRVVAYSLGNRGFVELTSRQNARMNALFERTDLKIVDEADVAALSRTAFIQGGGVGPTGNDLVEPQGVRDIAEILQKIQSIKAPDGNNGRTLKRINTNIIGWGHTYGANGQLAMTANVDAKSKEDLGAWQYSMIGGEIVFGSALEAAIISTFGKSDQKLGDLKDAAAISQVFRAMFNVESMHSDKESLHFTADGQPVSVENGAVQENTTDQSSTYNVAAVIFETQIRMERDNTGDNDVEIDEASASYGLNPLKVKKSISSGESTISQIFSRGRGRTLNCGGSATLDVAKEVAHAIFGGIAVNIMASSFAQTKRELGDKFRVEDTDAIVAGSQRLFDFFKNGGEIYKAGQKMRNGQIAQGGELMIDGNGSSVGLLFGAMDMSVNAAILTRSLAMYVFYIENGREADAKDNEAIEKLTKEIEANSTENIQTRIDYVKKYINNAKNSSNENKDKWTQDVIKKAFDTLDNIQIMDADLAGKDPDKIAQMANIRGKVTISNVNALRGVDFKSINMVIPDGDNFPSSEILQAIGRAGRNTDWNKQFAAVTIFVNSQGASSKDTYLTLQGDYDYLKSSGKPLFTGVNSWMNALFTCIKFNANPNPIFGSSETFEYVIGSEISKLPLGLQDAILAKRFDQDQKGLEEALKKNLNITDDADIKSRVDAIMNLAKNDAERVNNVLSQGLLEFITVYRSMQLKSESILFKANQESNYILVKEPLALAVSRLEEKGLMKEAAKLRELYIKSIQSKEGSLFGTSKDDDDKSADRSSPVEKLQNSFHSTLANAKEFLTEAIEIVGTSDPYLASDLLARYTDVEGMMSEGAFNALIAEGGSENPYFEYTFASASRTALDGHSPAKDIAKVLIKLMDQILPSQSDYTGDKLTYTQAVNLEFINATDMTDEEKLNLENAKTSLSEAYLQDANEYGTDQWNGLSYKNPSGDIVLTDKGKMLARVTAALAVPDEKTVALLMMLLKALGIDLEKILNADSLDLSQNLIPVVNALQGAGFNDSKSFSELLGVADNIDMDKLEDMNNQYYKQVAAFLKNTHLVDPQMSDENVIAKWQSMTYESRQQMLEKVSNAEYTLLASFDNPIAVPSVMETSVVSLLAIAGFDYSGSTKEFIKQQYNKDNHKSFASARLMALAEHNLLINNDVTYGEYGEINSKAGAFFGGLVEMLIGATLGFIGLTLGSLASLITGNPSLIPKLLSWWTSFFTEGGKSILQAFDSELYTMNESEFLTATYKDLLEMGSRMMSMGIQEDKQLNGERPKYWTESFSGFFIKFGKEASHLVQLGSGMSDVFKIKGWLTWTAGTVDSIVNPEINEIFANAEYEIAGSGDGSGSGAGADEQNTDNLSSQQQQELYVAFAMIEQDIQSWKARYANAVRTQIAKQNVLRFNAQENDQTAIDNMITLYTEAGKDADKVFAANPVLQALAVMAYVAVGAAILSGFLALIFLFALAAPAMVVATLVIMAVALVALMAKTGYDKNPSGVKAGWYIVNPFLWGSGSSMKNAVDSDNYRAIKMNDIGSFEKLTPYAKLLKDGKVDGAKPQGRGGHSSTSLWTKHIKKALRGKASVNSLILNHKELKKVEKFQEDQIKGIAQREMEKKGDVYKNDINKKADENKKLKEAHDKPYLDEARKRFKYSVGDFLALVDYLNMHSTADQQRLFAVLLPKTDSSVAVSRIQSLNAIPEENLSTSLDEIELNAISNDFNWDFIEEGLTFKSDAYIKTKKSLKQFRSTVEESLEDVNYQINSGIKSLENKRIDDIKNLKENIIKELTVTGDVLATRIKIMKALEITAKDLGITEDELLKVTDDTTNEQIIEAVLSSIAEVGDKNFTLLNKITDDLKAEFQVIDPAAQAVQAQDQQPQAETAWSKIISINEDSFYEKAEVPANVYKEIFDTVSQMQDKLTADLENMSVADLKKILEQIYGSDTALPQYDGEGDEKHFYAKQIIDRYTTIAGDESYGGKDDNLISLIKEYGQIFIIKQRYDYAQLKNDDDTRADLLEVLKTFGIRDVTDLNDSVFEELSNIYISQINAIVGKNAIQGNVEASIDNALTSDNLSSQQKLDRATEIRDALAKAIANGDTKKLIKYINRASAEFSIGSAVDQAIDIDALKAIAQTAISKLNLDIVKTKDFIKNSISKNDFEVAPSQNFYNRVAPLENAQKLTDASAGNGNSARLLNSMTGFTDPESYNTTLLRTLAHFNGISEMESYLGLSGSYTEKDIVNNAFETYATAVAAFADGEMSEEQLKRESEIIRMSSNILIASINKVKGAELKELINKDKLTETQISKVQTLIGKDHKVNNNVFIKNLNDYIDISFIEERRAASALFNIDMEKLKTAVEKKKPGSGISQEDDQDLLNIIAEGRRGKKNRTTVLMDINNARAVAQAA
jgi:hypothetical protein